MMNTVDIALKHGEEMYKQALQHAISIMEIDPENGLQFLKTKLANLNKDPDE